MSIKLYEHQNEARRYLRNNDYFALFMEQGTGKTLPILYDLSDKILLGLVKKALIISPLSTMGAWSRDIEKLSPRRQELLDGVVDVINYDKVWRREEYLNTEYDYVVLDESHFIKNRTSKRSKATRKIGKKAKYRYILTGSPISNKKLHEYWSQYDFLDSSIFGTWTQFQKRYIVLDPAFWQPKYYINQEQLLGIVNAFSYRITKQECLDLPDKLPDEIHRIEMTAKQKKYKKDAMDSYIEEFDIEIDNPLVKLLRLRQIASGFVTSDDGVEIFENNKIKVLKDLLETRGDSKTVIFAEYKYSIEIIQRTLDARKIKYVTLDGNQKDKNIWKRFQKEDDLQVIVCQYQSANAGIDLYASNCIIFYEPPLSSSVHEQARDRIHRIGQSKVCTYHYLLSEDSVEEKIYKTIKEGADFMKEGLEDYIRLEMINNE